MKNKYTYAEEAKLESLALRLRYYFPIPHPKNTYLVIKSNSLISDKRFDKVILNTLKTKNEIIYK